jgi:hypothetical protein
MLTTEALIATAPTKDESTAAADHGHGGGGF